MPVIDKKPSSWFRKANKKLDNLDANMNSLYKSTYASRPDNKKNLNLLTNQIDNNIDQIINNSSGPKISDISNLYLRTQRKRGVSNKEVIDNAMELFSDNSIIDSLSMNQELNKYIQAEDYQYDLICKYMPSLQTALDIKRDNVLSADNFSKEFLRIESPTISDDKLKIINDNIKKVSDKYKFSDIAEELYERASKYGEAFLYIVPYNVAIERLLKRKTTNNGSGILKQYTEGGGIKNPKYIGQDVVQQVTIFESSNMDSNLADQLRSVREKFDEDFSVNLIFEDSNIISSVIESKCKAKDIYNKSKSESLSEAYNVLLNEYKVDSDTNSKKLGKDTKFDKLDSGISDGLILNNGKNDDPKINEMNGCIIHFIDRADIIPIYIDDLCVGYYHFEFTMNQLANCNHGYGPVSASNNLVGSNNMGTMGSANDIVLSYISQKLSDSIDAHFINNNQDLKEEIYAILKYNEKFNSMNGSSDITVSFIPADDIYHFYLKQDRNTHRGISSLRRAVVPGIMYSVMYLTNTIGQITRAQDKRIYYVKQNIETNVARTMMNVINQIKKGNMGMRQLQSMNSMLSIVGKYNDHVIPVGQSGDPPIQFEVMDGQKIETPTELMERFQNDAVTTTDVPYEFTQSVNNVDYATRFTMSNSKFLRSVYKEQRICQNAFTDIFTRIYNYEYRENERMIKVVLPAPSFLSTANTQELINNNKGYIDAIIEVEMADEKDEKVKNETRRILLRNQLGNYIDYDKVDDAIDQARMAVAVRGDDNDQGDY